MHVQHVVGGHAGGALGGESFACICSPGGALATIGDASGDASATAITSGVGAFITGLTGGGGAGQLGGGVVWMGGQCFGLPFLPLPRPAESGADEFTTDEITTD